MRQYTEVVTSRSWLTAGQIRIVPGNFSEKGSISVSSGTNEAFVGLVFWPGIPSDSTPGQTWIPGWQLAEPTPSAALQASMDELDSGGGRRVKSVSELFEELETD